MATQGQTDFTDYIRVLGSTDNVQVVVKGNSTQTAKLQDWQNSAGSSLASVDKDGKIDVKGFTMATGGASGYVLQSDSCGVGTWVPANGMVGSSSALCNGRLTLTSGMAVTTGDVTAAQYIYFTPYKGNTVTLYNGTWWSEYALTNDVSVVVPSTTNRNYDVFLYDDAPNGLKLNVVAWVAPDSGSISSISSTAPVTVTVPASPAHTLSDGQKVTIVGNGVAANNGTWRVGTTTATTFQLKKLSDGTDLTAPGSVGNDGTWQRADQNTARETLTDIELQNGVYVRKDNHAYRYLGTIRTIAATDGTPGGCEDSAAKRYVWNNYNRVVRKLKVIESTDSWPYATAATWRAAHNGIANRVEMVIGGLVSEDIVAATVRAHQESTSANYGTAGIGLDSIIANSADLFGRIGNAGATAIAGPSIAFYSGYPGIGYHFVQWVEYRTAGTVTFYGDAGSLADVQSGLLAEVLA